MWDRAAARQTLPGRGGRTPLDGWGGDTAPVSQRDSAMDQVRGTGQDHNLISNQQQELVVATESHFSGVAVASLHCTV